MQVYLNNKKDYTKRELVEVELVKENLHTLWVKLPDGNVIKRQKNRDLPKPDEGKNE